MTELMVDPHDRITQASIWGDDITGLRCHAERYGGFETYRRSYTGHCSTGELSLSSKVIEADQIVRRAPPRHFENVLAKYTIILPSSTAKASKVSL
jgi:hypothetical protein